MAACTEPESELELGETSQELSGGDYQGGDYQGGDYQGGDYQGGDYQGGDYQGSDFAGATLNGGALSNVGLYQDRALVVWRSLRTLPLTYEQRLPDRTCIWNSARTILQSCTVSTGSSPLAGVTFGATFTRGGSSFAGKVRVVSAAKDTSMAMHPLLGHAGFVWPGQSAAVKCQALDYGVGGCENPRGCRINCDLWTYDLELVNADGTTDRFCPPSTRAYAVPGTYAEDGTFTPSTTKFTFACQNGTIAKCTRWGYRSFGKSTLSGGSTPFLVDFHRSCIRAAMADYCASGHSFTRDGTLVDIYDYPHNLNDDALGGLIPSTLSQYAGASRSGLTTESRFDTYGAQGIEVERYAELQSVGSIEDPVVGCPERFNLSGDDVGSRWDRLPEYGSMETWPRVGVATTTTCQHSEFLPGKYLSAGCSTCAFEVGESLPHCTDPSSSKGWNSQCVSLATSLCSQYSVGRPKMAPHHECTTGVKLEKYATGCTFRVCKDHPSCCNSSWTSTCVAHANSLCPSYNVNQLQQPFCFGAAPGSL